MSSIGPQLPSQSSTKRKHSSELDDDKGAKQARRNANEIDLEDDSDSDDYGPQAPGAAPAPTVSKPAPGPSLPPTAAASRNQDEIDLEDDSDDDDTGPAPPPTAAAPPPPPQPAAAAADDSDSDSDDSDDYGPALPSATNRRGPIGPSMPPAEDTSAPARDEWMLAPPVNSGYSERDPTKLKARKFASKPSNSSSSGADTGLAAIWTETPEEKLKRLQDSVLGRSDGSGKSAGEVAAADAKTKEEEERNRKIAASIAAHRGKSLYDEHNHQADKGAGGKKKDDDDDPSKRAFDREKDMALGSKIGTAQRKELVAKSANFGGRFQKGSFL